MIKNYQQGITLVEVLIASAIIMAAVVALLGVHSLYFKTALQNTDILKATYLAEEGVEAVRFLRDASWSTHISPLTLNTNYGLVPSGTSWLTSATNTATLGFTRTVRLSAVYRDASDDVVASGGTLDSNTKLLTATVSWNQNGTTTSKTISTYLTNLWSN